MSKAAVSAKEWLQLRVDLQDLYVQATKERSHYYTGAVLKRCIAVMDRMFVGVKP